MKHAQAERAQVRAFLKHQTVYLEVPALGGRRSVESPAQGGTILAATLPLRSK